ncbi:MAG: hypothetical protein Q8Q33_06690 [Chlamydiota bacterium]|nr:hypothetical protein [Chlamydiota bacterium]
MGLIVKQLCHVMDSCLKNAGMTQDEVCSDPNIKLEWRYILQRREVWE